MTPKTCRENILCHSLRMPKRGTSGANWRHATPKPHAQALVYMAMHRLQMAESIAHQLVKSTQTISDPAVPNQQWLYAQHSPPKPPSKYRSQGMYWREGLVPPHRYAESTGLAACVVWDRCGVCLYGLTDGTAMLIVSVWMDACICVCTGHSGNVLLAGSWLAVSCNKRLGLFCGSSLRGVAAEVCFRFCVDVHEGILYCALITHAGFVCHSLCDTDDQHVTNHDALMKALRYGPTAPGKNRMPNTKRSGIVHVRHLIQ